MRKQPLPPSVSDFPDFEEWVKANEEYRARISGDGNLAKLKRTCSACPHYGNCPLLNLAYTTRQSLCPQMRSRVALPGGTCFSKSGLYSFLQQNLN